MTEAQRSALISMMNAITAVPWCPTDIAARAHALLRKLGVTTPDVTLGDIFDNLFGAGKWGRQ